jgi:hypothetical protein
LRRRYGHAGRRPRVIYWVRSVGPSGKDRVAMLYKGVLRRDTDEGMAGDIKARPAHLGPGPYTGVFGSDAFELEDGTPFEGGA